MIQAYKHPLLTGKDCYIHTDFVPGMDMFVRFLEASGCKASVNCSYDPNHLSLTPADGAIVKPASHGDHLVGCAIDCNLIDKTGHKWTSGEMEVFAPESKNYKPSTPGNGVIEFINMIRNSKVLRWGGDFMKFDTIHYDNNLYLRNPARWQEIIDELKAK
jgi:hypothetical protein